MTDLLHEIPLYLLLSLVLLTAAAYDLKHQKIPNILTFTLAAFGLIYHSIFSGLGGFMFSGAGLLLGTALFLPPYMLGGMGAGDAKLMGAVGAVVGAKGVFVAALLTALIGGIYALLLLLVFRKYGRAMFSRAWAVLKTLVLTRQYVPETAPNPVSEKPRLCYGLAIALGTVIYLWLDYTGFDFRL